MTDPIKVTSEQIPPLAVTIIGTGNGRGDPPTGTIAMTPDPHQPNLVVTIITPFVAILVRFLNVYVGMLAGLLATAMASNAIPAPDFWHLVLKCASLAIGGAVVLSMKDIITVFTGLEKKYPLLTGSV